MSARVGISVWEDKAGNSGALEKSSLVGACIIQMRQGWEIPKAPVCCIDSLSANRPVNCRLRTLDSHWRKYGKQHQIGGNHSPINPQPQI